MAEPTKKQIFIGQLQQMANLVNDTNGVLYGISVTIGGNVKVNNLTTNEKKAFKTVVKNYWQDLHQAYTDWKQEELDIIDD